MRAVAEVYLQPPRPLGSAGVIGDRGVRASLGGALGVQAIAGRRALRLEQTETPLTGGSLIAKILKPAALNEFDIALSDRICRVEIGSAIEYVRT